MLLGAQQYLAAKAVVDLADSGDTRVIGFKLSPFDFYKLNHNIIPDGNRITKQPFLCGGVLFVRRGGIGSYYWF